ncbi:hypothetical protein MPL3356_60605 [Mesorhizobium plurifarium]|uniref:Uncharacterized protein n=1 Tax=Mesorhizobium plurifarium TaxID=69974 RepID=A0A090EA95_MESPL|nr:hypothetical protein MPL3356_60605 [Mesorhizobium plurifarium]
MSNPLASHSLRVLALWADMRVISSARYVEERDRRLAEEVEHSLETIFPLEPQPAAPVSP